MKNKNTNTSDKLRYTLAEKIIEIICGVLVLAMLAVEISFMAMGAMSLTGILFIVIMLAAYGALTFCGLRPLRVNFLFRPEEVNEHTMRFLRMGCIMIKLLICMAVFSVSLLTAFS